jgi:hypothetical protein
MQGPSLGQKLNPQIATLEAALDDMAGPHQVRGAK